MTTTPTRAMRTTARTAPGRLRGGRRWSGDRSRLGDEAADLAEMLVALGTRDQAGGRGVDLHPGEGRLGQQQVAGRAPHTILQQPMHQDDLGSAELGPSGHRLPEKRSMVGDDLEVKTADAAAGAARAALVGGQDAPP